MLIGSLAYTRTHVVIAHQTQLTAFCVCALLRQQLPTCTLIECSANWTKLIISSMDFDFSLCLEWNAMKNANQLPRAHCVRFYLKILCSRFLVCHVAVSLFPHSAIRVCSPFMLGTILLCWYFVASVFFWSRVNSESAFCAASSLSITYSLTLHL